MVWPKENPLFNPPVLAVLLPNNELPVVPVFVCCCPNIPEDVCVCCPALFCPNEKPPDPADLFPNKEPLPVLPPELVAGLPKLNIYSGFYLPVTEENFSMAIYHVSSFGTTSVDNVKW